MCVAQETESSAKSHSPTGGNKFQMSETLAADTKTDRCMCKELKEDKFSQESSSCCCGMAAVGSYPCVHSKSGTTGISWARNKYFWEQEKLYCLVSCDSLFCGWLSEANKGQELNKAFPVVRASCVDSPGSNNTVHLPLLLFLQRGTNLDVCPLHKCQTFRNLY